MMSAKSHLPIGIYSEAHAAGPWPPSRTKVGTVHNPAAERNVAWRMLSAASDLPHETRALFPGSAAKFLPDFRGFLRLAALYDNVAISVQGSPSALLHYYSALQLAKAELLVHMPSTVFNTKVGHGLSFNPEEGKSLNGDSLKVQNGVFRELYEHRTGVQLPIGTRLKVTALLRSCSDIAFEVEQAQLGRCTAAAIEHFVVGGPSGAKSLFFFDDQKFLTGRNATSAQLLKSYRKVRPSAALPASNAVPAVAFESRWEIPLSKPPDFTPVDIDRTCERASKELSLFLGIPIYGRTMFSTSLRKSSLLAVPPDLARYAAMFYLSSVVRYKPSRLEADGWILDAFSTEAGVHLLRAAVWGITGTLYRFVTPEAAALGLYR